MKYNIANEAVSTAIADLENLIINSKPADGPMIKGILMISLVGIDASKADISEYDKEKLNHINKVYDQLCAGRYDILPAFRV